MSAMAVRLEREAGVATIALDRPPLNILDIAMLRDIEAALTDVQADRRQKVLLLAACGRAFCAGVDVADHTADRVRPMLAALHGVVQQLLSLEIPVVAAVNGAALGGGCELLQACDVVLAADTAKLGQPEIRLGVFPPVAAALLSSRVGPQAAADLVLSGRVVDAAEALRLGLVSRVVPAATLAQEARAYATAVAASSGPVLRLAKRALAFGRDWPGPQALARTEALYLDELMALSDAHEGIAAFLEKRAPQWHEA